MNMEKKIAIKGNNSWLLFIAPHPHLVMYVCGLTSQPSEQKGMVFISNTLSMEQILTFHAQTMNLARLYQRQIVPDDIDL